VATETRVWFDTIFVDDFPEVFFVAAAAALDFVFFFVDFTGVTFKALAVLLDCVFFFHRF
jgi:hypothetical protein